MTAVRGGLFVSCRQATRAGGKNSGRRAEMERQKDERKGKKRSGGRMKNKLVVRHGRTC